MKRDNVKTGPRLYPAVIYATLAALAWWSSLSTYGLPAAVLLGLTFVAIGAGGFAALNWLAWSAIQRMREYAAGQATAELQLLDARRQFLLQIQALNPDQLKAVGLFRLGVEVTPDDYGPIYRYRIGEVDFTFDELSAFWTASGKVYLAPVGRWGEGSRMRKVAEVITAWLIADGCAERASGPNPARWIDRERAAVKLGIDLEEVKE